MTNDIRTRWLFWLAWEMLRSYCDHPSHTSPTAHRHDPESQRPIRTAPAQLMASHHAAAQLRLLSDLRAIKQEPPEGCSASPVSDENLYCWQASIFGPEETPWEGGIFTLKLQFSERYPEKPPRVRFTCEMFHPNIYSDGNICMDTIQDKWSPCQNICTVLMSIQSLLTDPNCSSPANPEAAQLYQKDQPAYNRRVRRIAQKSIEGC